MTNKTWGGRFKKSLDPLAIKFNASLTFDHVLYHHDIIGSKAHALMLGHQGIISLEESELICSTLDIIEHEIQAGLHALNDQYEDVHMFIEHLLIEKIGDVGKKLHTGRSRNDQVALDLRLYTREAIDKLMLLLGDVCVCLSKQSLQYAQVKMPGYTHLQQAQPIQLAWFFNAYQQMFNRDLGRLADSKERMNFSPLGAGALAGSSLPLNRHMVAKQLGFNGIVENTLDAVSDRDFILEFFSAASIIMVHLSRLSEDLILWATQEFGYITLDDAFATGSSLMPNKKNPDILELMRGKSGRVFGHLIGLLTVMKGLPLAYNKDMQEDKEALFDTVNTLTTCLTILPPFLESVQFNTEKMEKRANQGFLDATKILESLVMQGLPFREAHHQVGLWVANAIENDCALSEMIPDDALNNAKPFISRQSTNKIKHVLSGDELTSQDILMLLDKASQIKAHASQYQKTLEGKNLAMIFSKPSFRTRLSFTLAMQQLGGTTIESVSTTRKSEEPKDAIRVLNGYSDAVMVRTHDDSDLLEMAQHATIPIINGLSALYHPCQVLADLLSLKERFGTLDGLTLAYIGDGNNVLHSLLLMAPRVGVKIHYCCPKNNQPNASVLEQSKRGFKDMIICFENPEQAVKYAHAVYTDVWTSMGFEESSSEKEFEGFQVNESLLEEALPQAVFMHCMPMERGKEVSQTLPDHPCSIIFLQSENRLHVQKALLVNVL